MADRQSLWLRAFLPVVVSPDLDYLAPAEILAAPSTVPPIGAGCPLPKEDKGQLNGAILGRPVTSATSTHCSGREAGKGERIAVHYAIERPRQAHLGTRFRPARYNYCRLTDG